jgi:hypothetical protein
MNTYLIAHTERTAARMRQVAEGARGKSVAELTNYERLAICWLAGVEIAIEWDGVGNPQVVVTSAVLILKNGDGFTVVEGK